MAGRQDIEAGRAFVRLFLKNDLTSQMSKALRGVSRQLTSAGQSMSRLGMSAVRVGTVAAAPFALALATFKSFDDQMRRVQAVTGSTGDMFDLLTSKAKELGSTTAFTASQAADGMAFLGQAGFSAQQILEGIPAVLDLAAAGAIDLGEAADIASNIAGGFGLASDEIGRVSDVLAKTAASSNTNILELGEAFAKAAPAAKAAGQEIEEASAAIGILGDSGVKASVAGTDVKNILTEMAKRADIAGVKTQDASGNIRDMLSVMKDIGGATSGMSEAERLSFFIDTFGKRSAKSAIILTSANKRIDEMRLKLAGAEGAAKEMAATMEGGIGGAWRKFRSAVEGVAISIGESLAPTLKILAEQLSAALGKVKAYIEANKGMVKAAAALVAGVLAGGAALTVLGSILSAVGVALGVVAAAIPLIVGGLGLLLTPLGAVAGLLVGGIALWARYTSSGQKAVSDIVGTFATLKTKATETFGAIWAALKAGDFATAFKILKTSALIAFEIIKGQSEFLFRRYIPALVSGTFAGLVSGFKVVANHWRQVLSSVWVLFADLAKNRFVAIGELFHVMGGRIGKQFHNLWVLFKDLAVVYLNTVARIYRAVWDVLADATGSAIDTALNTSLQSFVKNVMSILPRIAKAVASSMAGKVGIAVEAAGLGLKILQTDAAKGAGGDAADFGKKIIDAIAKGSQGEASDVTAGKILSDFGAIAGTELQALKDTFGTIGDMLGKDAEALSNFAGSLSGLGDEAKAAFLTEFTDATTGISGPLNTAAIDALKKKLSELTTKALTLKAEEVKGKAVAVVGKGGAIAGAGAGVEDDGGAMTAGTAQSGFQATFSAAAAVGASMLGTKPGDAIDPGRQARIELIRTQKEQLTEQREQAKLTRVANMNMERFLAGQMVR